MNIFDLERFSEDAFRVKRAYIDIAEDLISGILLGQIVYWNMPNKQGKTKLRVVKEGKLWLAKGRTEWWDEIRITPKQFDRAIKILKDKSLVETKLYKFNGAPTQHISLNDSVLHQRLKSIFTNEEIGFSPKVKMEIPQTVNSLTEITTETTAKITTDIKTDQQADPKKAYSDEFETFWSAYPRKADKKQAYRKWKEAIKTNSIESIMTGLIGYKQQIEINKTESTYIKHAKTFLGNESFNEYEVIQGHETSGEQLKKQYNLPF